MLNPCALCSLFACLLKKDALEGARFLLSIALLEQQQKVEVARHNGDGNLIDRGCSGIFSKLKVQYFKTHLLAQTLIDLC